jgi:DNA-binding CsgD family transcriptional regulator
MEFDTKLLSAAQEEILDRARENPELSNAEIAERTGHRLPLVRDTRAEHGEQRSGGGSAGGKIVKPTDSASFNETEAAVLEAALRSPEATNAEIAERAGVHVGLVRDIRQQYEDEATLAGDSNRSAAAADSTAEDDSIDESDSAVAGGHDHDTSDLSSTQQAILETAAANPDDSSAEIADAVGARLPLVRDTLDEYGEDATATAATATSPPDSEGATAEAASSLQQEIIELARENPELTNAEIAERTGARIALVRDTREEHDISVAA